MDVIFSTVLIKSVHNILLQNKHFFKLVGAMSFGSISEATHKTLAIAMNRLVLV